MYILPQNLQTRRLSGMRGGYRGSNFPLPVDGLQAALAAPAAAASVAKAAARAGRQRPQGMSGGYANTNWTAPPYRNAGLGLTFADAQTWAMAPNSFLPSLNNLEVFGGAALGLWFLMGRRGRR